MQLLEDFKKSVEQYETRVETRDFFQELFMLLGKIGIVSVYESNAMIGKPAILTVEFERGYSGAPKMKITGFAPVNPDSNDYAIKLETEYFGSKETRQIRWRDRNSVLLNEIAHWLMPLEGPAIKAKLQTMAPPAVA